MTNITVNVFGGVAPLPIRVVIDNLDNNDDMKFTRNKSFNENYNLPSGRYSIIISGMNPSGGRTEMQVSGNFVEGPLPTARKTTNETYYSQFFYIVINN